MILTVFTMANKHLSPDKKEALQRLGESSMSQAKIAHAIGTFQAIVPRYFTQ